MKKGGDGAVLAGFIQLGGANLLFESKVKGGVLAGVLHIPEGRFPKCVVALLGGFVVRVQVKGSAAFNVHALYKHRELRAVPVEGSFSGNPFEVGLHYVSDGVSSKPALGGHGIYESKVCEFIFYASPRGVLFVREEFQGSQFFGFAIHKTRFSAM